MAAGSRNGRSFAPSRAARNPCRHLAGRRGDGEVREASRGEAIARAAETPHIILNAPLVGQRLGYPDLSAGSTCSSCSPSSIRRGSRCRPSAGLSRALGLEPPASEAEAAAALQRDRRAAARRCSPIPTGASARARGRRTRRCTGSAGAGRRWSARGSSGPSAASACCSRGSSNGRKPASGRRRARSSIDPAEARREARPADRPRRSARGPASDGRSGDLRCSRPSARRARPTCCWPRPGPGSARRSPISRRPSLWAEQVGRHGVGLDLHQGAAAAARRRRAASCSPIPRSARGGSSSARAARIICACSISRMRCRARSRAARRSSRSWSGAGRPTRKDGDMVGGDLPGWLPSLFRRAGAAALTDRRGECVYAGCPHYRRCFIERAERAEPRGRHRHRQPCAGDGQRRARARGRAAADPVRRGPSSVRRRRFRPSRSRSAGRKRSSCGAGSSGRKAARAGGGAGSRRG